jgi:zinc transporter
MHNPPDTPQALHLLYEPAGFICAFRFEEGHARQMNWNEVIDYHPVRRISPGCTSRRPM